MQNASSEAQHESIPTVTWADVLATIFFAATVVLIVAWLGRIGIDSLPPEVSHLVRDGWAWLASAAGGLIVALLFRRPITVWHVVSTAILALAMGAAVVQLNSDRAGRIVVDGATAIAQIQQRIDETRIEFFHTGEGTKPSAGTHFACYKDNEAPALVCGKSASPVVTQKYKVHSGDKCGYNYYAVACLPNR